MRHFLFCVVGLDFGKLQHFWVGHILAVLLDGLYVAWRFLYCFVDGYNYCVFMFWIYLHLFGCFLRDADLKTLRCVAWRCATPAADCLYVWLAACSHHTPMDLFSTVFKWSFRSISSRRKKERKETEGKWYPTTVCVWLISSCLYPTPLHTHYPFFFPPPPYHYFAFLQAPTHTHFGTWTQTLWCCWLGGWTLHGYGYSSSSSLTRWNVLPVN